MVKFPHAGLLLQLFADAFLITQLADSKSNGRKNGSKFRDELKELSKGNTLKNFKNVGSYLTTQLTELDKTRFLYVMTCEFSSFYLQLLKNRNVGKASHQEIYEWLLSDACHIIAASINRGWHSAYAPSNKIAKKIHAAWFLPDLQKNESGLAVFFNWLETSHSLTRYQIAKKYDASKKLNKDDQGSALRSYWSELSKTGEFGKVNLQTFKKLEEAIWLSIENKGLMDKDRLRLNLLLARGFDYFISELQVIPRTESQKVFSAEKLNQAITLIKNLVSQNVKEEAMVKASEQWKYRGFHLDKNNKLPKLYKPTDVEKPKNKNDEQIAKDLFKFFDKNPPAEFLTPILHWYYGRFYVLSGELKKALGFYKDAFDAVQFVWGSDPAEKIISESLALSAYLGKDRRFFEEVYHYGALIGLFKSIEEREVDYHYHKWSLAFNTYFLPHTYYSSVSDKEKQKIIEKGSWVKMAKYDDLNKAANKKTKSNVSNTRPKNQLQHAISAPTKTAKDVIKLIDDGVDINLKDNSGSTALIEVLQFYYGELGTNRNEKALKIINRLLKENLSPSINSVTKGNGISALSLAIEFFDMEMINKLLEIKDMDVTTPCGRPAMSYVYYTLSRYAVHKKMLSMSSSVEMLAMSLQNNETPNPQFGATAQEQVAHTMRLMQKSSGKNMHEAVFKCYQKAYQEINATEDKVIEIIELLFRKGASPDGHFINDLTPLMFATELGLIKVVKLLLEEDADINAENNCGKKALDYAIGYERSEIKSILQAA